MSLPLVTRFLVPRAVVAETEAALRTAGQNGCEAFVLWSGRQDGRVFRVLTNHVPRQTAYRLESGLCVRVAGEELHRLNVWLFEAGQILAVEVHAHPTDAYHSDTDDAYPIVSTIGGLSTVVPDFCRRGLMVDGTAVYRLDGREWVRESTDVIEVV